MSNNLQLVGRLFDLSRHGDFDNAEFAHLDALVYRRLQQTYADDETFAADFQTTESVAPAAITRAA